MNRLGILTALLTIILLPSLLSAETVTFIGLSPTLGDDRLILKANLTKPEGSGTFPAIIMMHGCSGDSAKYDPWEKRFVQWGYVVLRVDSLTPRKKQTFCDMPGVARLRAQDAYDAKSYLLGLSYVDKQKIGLIGWSQGGMAALYAVDDSTRIEERGKPFQCAVSLYPYCNSIDNLNAPLLVLIGEKDDWCPSVLCEILLPTKDLQHELTLKIYKNAYHCFDLEGIVTAYAVHRLEYNPEAAKDAIKQVKSFFKRYL